MSEAPEDHIHEFDYKAFWHALPEHYHHRVKCPPYQYDTLAWLRPRDQDPVSEATDLAEAYAEMYAQEDALKSVVDYLMSEHGKTMEEIESVVRKDDRDRSIWRCPPHTAMERLCDAYHDELRVRRQPCYGA
jgi:ABC-type Zn2+ transport system, periplasmic component/surface adhesin